MHDWEDARASEVIAFDGRKILEEPAHPAVAGAERGGRPGRVERVDFAAGQHRRQRLVRTDVAHADARRQVERQLFGAARLFESARHVVDALDWHAMRVGENSADPDGRRHLVFRRADGAADQILRPFDAGGGVHVDARMPEEPRQENRDRHERRIVGEERHDIRGQRHLRDLELAVAQHAEEGLFHGQVQAGEVDAVGPHAAVEERAGTVVAPAREGQRQSRHGATLTGALHPAERPRQEPR